MEYVKQDIPPWSLYRINMICLGPYEGRPNRSSPTCNHYVSSRHGYNYTRSTPF